MTERSDDLVTHLKAYGFVHFDDEDDYRQWSKARLGKHLAQLMRLQNRTDVDVPPPSAMRAVYDFTASPTIHGIVASQQTDDIARTTAAVAAAISGRQRILDIGCNVGYSSTWFAKAGGEGCEVLGVDFAPRCIGAAASYATQLAIRNATFRGVDVSKALPSGPFDAVVDMASIQYMGDPRAVFGRVASVLAPDGIAVTAPMLGRKWEVSSYLSALSDAGLFVKSMDWIYSSRFGSVVARPIIVADLLGPAAVIDLDVEFSNIRRRIATEAIAPMFSVLGHGGPA